MPSGTQQATVNSEGMAGWLSRYAREKKLEFFFRGVPFDAAVLDVGCADGWVKGWAAERGWADVTGIDLVGPADIVGDVNDWKNLGLRPRSFDIVVAFEVVEHCDMAEALHALLKPSGRLFVTSPVPHMDWACRALEQIGLLQPRTSDHTHLVDLRQYPRFSAIDHRVKGLVAQWAVLSP